MIGGLVRGRPPRKSGRRAARARGGEVRGFGRSAILQSASEAELMTSSQAGPQMMLLLTSTHVSEEGGARES